MGLELVIQLTDKSNGKYETNNRAFFEHLVCDRLDVQDSEFLKRPISTYIGKRLKHCIPDLLDTPMMIEILETLFIKRVPYLNEVFNCGNDHLRYEIYSLKTIDLKPNIATLKLQQLSDIYRRFKLSEEASRLKTHFLGNLCQKLLIPVQEIIEASGYLAESKLNEYQMDLNENIKHSSFCHV